MTQQRSWFEVVADCQEAVRRIRAVLTTGGAATPDVQADLDFVILTIRNWLYGRARKLAFADSAPISQLPQTESCLSYDENIDRRMSYLKVKAWM